MFSKEELSEIFGQTVSENADDICIDSRSVKKGDVFVAVKGEQYDGHDFIKQAVNDGAAFAISERNVQGIDSDRIIKVDSSFEALNKLAKYNVAKTAAKYVGITGSVGKTTTKQLIYHALSKQPELRGKVYTTRKNFNGQIGLPICAATMPRSTEIGVFEMGMSARGEIKKLLKIIQPSVSVISQICETHLEFFGSIWEIAKAKAEIFETAAPQEAAIIPADCAFADFLKQKARENGIKNIFTFGSQDSDAKILECRQREESSEIVAEILGEKVRYEVCGVSDSLIRNILSSLLCAHVISKIPLQKLADALASFESPSGRGGVFHLKERDIILIDDAYNACPTSVKSAIRSLAKYEGCRKILALGDMLELGRDANLYHENLSATIDKYGVDLVFTCGSLSKYLFDNLRDCKKGGYFENSAQLAEKISDKIKNDDCVLVKGSNSMKMNLVVEAVKRLENSNVL
ncbi:MAG: UDP-N-acetylmuramoyl-tripeptide--D-alanyl-D-alanine ligase [Holosporaceae bacterium]|jgi:UDP-N-acetylmuramoyl-tripeptide--D-alanyl-D-alanine ligase|nr:UDP-N-acetylmuramoyl-tripeptide--D-alanyl-D-alanine ligase [Holosporaceae bacterium]